MLWSCFPAPGTDASIPVSILNLVISVQLVALSYFEHSRSVKPSTLLVGYLLFSWILDVAQLRTLYLLGQLSGIAALFSASWGLRLVMLVVESHEKVPCLRLEHQNLSPETTSGIVNRSFLWWLNKIFRIGSRGIISEDDLFELEPNLAAENVGGKIKDAWEKRCMFRH